MNMGQDQVKVIFFNLIILSFNEEHKKFQIMWMYHHKTFRPKLINQCNKCNNNSSNIYNKILKSLGNNLKYLNKMVIQAIHHS